MIVHPMEEYIDALVTCELAMMIAIKYQESPDFAVRQCALTQSIKCIDVRNMHLFLRISKSEAPALMVYHFRTMLDEELSK